MSYKSIKRMRNYKLNQAVRWPGPQEKHLGGQFGKQENLMANS